MRVETISGVQNFRSWKYLLSFSLLFIIQLNSAVVFAQVKTVTGTVNDAKGTPMIGVNVTVKGTNAGAITDSRGIYSVSAAPGSVLMFSFAGYNGVEQTVDSRATIDVSLTENPQSLENVVVIGYGTQKKVNLSGSVSQVSGKDLINRPVPNVTGALQGVLPGVTVVRGSGQPGDEGYGIRIRGFTSANSASALVLVDGIEQDMNLIDPNDVESLTVLKDASASAIYGARAAAGVVLITTKQGSAGKTRISFNSYYGVNITARQPQRLNSWDEQILIDEARKNATGSPEFNAEQLEWLMNPNFSVRPNPTQDRWEYFGNNNWLKEGMDKINHMQNYALSVSGGEQKLNYLLSGSYYKRDGVMRYGPDNNFRTNLKLNVNAELNKYVSLKLTTGYIGSVTEENAFGTDQIINRLYRSRTRQSLYAPEALAGQKYNGDLQINPVDIEQNGGFEKRSYETFTGRLGLQVKNVVKGLTFDVVGWRNQNNYNMENNSRTLLWYGRTTNTLRGSINTPNSISIVKNKAYQNNLQGFFTYSLKVKDHDFKIMQGASYEEYRKDEASASAYNMITNDFFTLNLGDPLLAKSAEKVETWALGSLFGRFNYSFRGKYLFEASYRYDGSSRLAPTKRWDLFPSFSAAWRVSEENFIKDHFSFIDNLKVRVSWGQLGNGSPLSLYPYIALLTSGLSQPPNEPNLVFNDIRSQYLYQNTLASPEVTWETVQQSNIGIDLGLLKNRLNITFDLYEKRNKDMLARLELPNIIGINTPSFNVGELKSWGAELDVKWRDHLSKDIDYRVGFNISDNQNKLVKYNGISTINGPGVVNLLEGYAMNTVWGYRTAPGYFNTQAEVDAYKSKVTPLFPNTGPGDIQYLDLNGNGRIDAGENNPRNPGDLVYLGTTNARYTYGFDLGITWKRLDFSLFFQGALKRTFLIDQGTMSPLNQTADMPWTIHMDRWTQYSAGLYTSDQ
ncbi:MAG: SusC/RagA family TonB-linked outer membrane protein [Chitinophagaceae bacterium]|nr:MAG: SusC/RagA family TonB-linked outer membrane protein [Chitinophagaceae bacterium]